MSTPTDQQQIRTSVRRHAKNKGDAAAAALAIVSAIDILGVVCVMSAASSLLPFESARGALAWRTIDEPDSAIPPLMGTAEVAEAFGIKNSNISKLPDAVRPVPVARISNGTTPVYLASEVMAKAAQYRPRTRA